MHISGLRTLIQFCQLKNSWNFQKIYLSPDCFCLLRLSESIKQIIVCTPDSSQVSLVPLWGLRHIPNSDQALDRETQDQTRQLLGKHSASHSTQSGTTRNFTSNHCLELIHLHFHQSCHWNANFDKPQMAKLNYRYRFVLDQLVQFSVNVHLNSVLVSYSSIADNLAFK